MVLGQLVTILALVSCTLASDPICDGLGFQIIPKSNCRGSYMCSNGIPIEMPDCPPNTVFSTGALVCVHIGSEFDDCVAETIVDKCLTFTTSRFPHPINCHQYYDCSVFYDPIPLLFEQHLVECTYPQLYNTETQQCEDFGNVQCGTRTEPVDGCEYLANQCPVAHCIPCSIRYPSCRGLDDGINANPSKLWSPSFIVCDRQRFISEDFCTSPLILFHRDLNQCVSVDMIPVEHGGTQTIEDRCLLDMTAIIPHPTKCHQYYDCSVTYDPIPPFYEQHLVECTYPQLYNTETQQCEDFGNVQCGSRIESVDGCDYIVNQCPVASCQPCSLRFPSCNGLSDGNHEHPDKQWSKFFIRCMQNRFISEESCPSGTDGRPDIFHPGQDQCVSPDLVPQENGGTMPDCTGLSDGGHMDNLGRCDRYFICSTGQFVRTELCLPGDVYDSEGRVCKLSSFACPPCGTSTLCSSGTVPVLPP